MTFSNMLLKNRCANITPGAAKELALKVLKHA